MGFRAFYKTFFQSMTILHFNFQPKIRSVIGETIESCLRNALFSQNIVLIVGKTSASICGSMNHKF